MGAIGVTAAEDAVRARRRLTNKITAAAKRCGFPVLHPDVKLIADDGTLIQGSDQVVQAFAAQFQERSFVAYVRTTETVTIDQDGDRAAESGSWIGTWKDVAAQASPSSIWQCGGGSASGRPSSSSTSRSPKSAPAD